MIDGDRCNVYCILFVSFIEFILRNGDGLKVGREKGGERERDREKKQEYVYIYIIYYIYI